MDGFKGAGSPLLCTFFVREPESKWVTNNLLDGMRAETVHGGVRITTEDERLSVLPSCAFSLVRDLGEAARPETAGLARAVAEIARGALEQAEAALRHLTDPLLTEDAENATAQLRSDV